MAATNELPTERLRLRPIVSGDREAITILGADARVMASLGGVMTSEGCERWLDKQLAHWQAHGFGRYVIEREGTFVGLVGLTRADYDAGITPAIEIAWRLAFDHWGHGYATEGARAAIRQGFDELGLSAIVGVTTPGNLRSRRVMDRLGMVHSPSETFEHPHLPEGDPLRTHVVYRLARSGR